MTLAIVLGGGGSAGVAWEIGVLTGLREHGLDATSAATLVGTSAGSIVSVQLIAGPGLPALYEQVRRPVDARPMDLDFAAVSASWVTAAAGATSAEEARSRIGRLALDAQTMPASRRREQLAALLPTSQWPETRIVTTAVSARTGRFRTFDSDSGVELVAAVGASCAVPGVWPPVMIEDEPFMDGAVRSPTNTSVAAGHSRVLVIAALLPALGGGIERELASLGEAASEVIGADAASAAAFGPNPLDVTVGPAAAAEGLRQGRDAADRVRHLFTP